MLYQTLLCVIVPMVWSSTVPHSLDVHCSVKETAGCLITDPIFIEEPARLNFVSEINFNTAAYLNITYDSNDESNITAIPTGIFETFTKLSELKILETRLSLLRKDDFRGANNLNRLVLENNKVNLLPANVFEYAPKLEYIDLGWNSNLTIEDFAFSGCSHLHTLILDFTDIKVITENTFVGAENLVDLALRNNKIKRIANGAFNFPQLEVLSLSANRLKTLSNSLFSRTPKLKEIYLDLNRITAIRNSLYNLRNLQKVDLSSNKINDFNLIKFAKLPQLTELLARNGLTDFNSKLEGLKDLAINFNSSITHLDISGNSINRRDILHLFAFLNNLEELYIRSNSFVEIDDLSNVRNILPHIKKIDLQSNGFSKEKYEPIFTKLRSENVEIVDINILDNTSVIEQIRLSLERQFGLR